MDKNILKSKTFWLQVITIASAFVPAVQGFLASNPETTVAVIGALNVLIRFATKGKVSLA